MTNPELQSAWLRLEYSVHTTANDIYPTMHILRQRLDRVGRKVGGPSQAARENIIFALQRVPVPGAETQYVFWRQINELPFGFDSDASVIPIHAQCKLVMALDVGGPQPVAATLSFPVKSVDAIRFQHANVLPGQIDIYVDKVRQGGVDVFRWYVVDQPGAPATTSCAGCKNNPSPEKQAQCAANGCYGTKPTTPNHLPAGA
jgi:hypothetical protein